MPGAALARLSAGPLDPANPMGMLMLQSLLLQAISMQLMQLLLGLMQGSARASAAPSASSPVTSAGPGSTQERGGSPVSAQQGRLKTGGGGKVNPKDLQAYLEQRIAGSRLNGFKPRDGAQYGVDGSPRSWAAFMTKLVGQESGYDTNAVGDVGVFRGGSRGLFQLSYDDATNYGLNGGKPFTASQLADPAVNADAAVAIMERLVTKKGSISGGAGQYWGPIKRGWNG